MLFKQCIKKTEGKTGCQTDIGLVWGFLEWNVSYNKKILIFRLFRNYCRQLITQSFRKVILIRCLGNCILILLVRPSLILWALGFRESVLILTLPARIKYFSRGLLHKVTYFLH